MLVCPTRTKPRPSGAKPATLTPDGPGPGITPVAAAASEVHAPAGPPAWGPAHSAMSAYCGSNMGTLSPS